MGNNMRAYSAEQRRRDILATGCCRDCGHDRRCTLRCGAKLLTDDEYLDRLRAEGE